MGYEWLEPIAQILNEAGIRAAQAYPAAGVPELSGPVAALSIEELDTDTGSAQVAVQILSPRTGGGWMCQEAAVTAVSALSAAGYVCRSNAVEYQSGSDCFSQKIVVQLALALREAVWAAQEHWEFLWNDAALAGVESFTADEDRGRRMVGAFWQAQQVGVTPGAGGWNIAMVQRIGPEDAEPEEPEEPFTLTVRRPAETVVYGECYWNRILRRYTQQGLVVERSGFALTREVQ